MKPRVEYGLLFADATFTYRGKVLQLRSVMVDTASAGAVLPTNWRRVGIFRLGVR
jgi:hypothetical protein